MHDIRPKRRNGVANVWAWPTRIYIPCPLAVKVQFAEQARLVRMSQAELGLIVIEGTLDVEGRIQQLVTKYKEVRDATS